jgi:hypothetical protein
VEAAELRWEDLQLGDLLLPGPLPVHHAQLKGTHVLVTLLTPSSEPAGKGGEGKAGAGAAAGGAPADKAAEPEPQRTSASSRGGRGEGPAGKGTSGGGKAEKEAGRSKSAEEKEAKELEERLKEAAGRLAELEEHPRLAKLAGGWGVAGGHESVEGGWLVHTDLEVGWFTLATPCRGRLRAAPPRSRVGSDCAGRSAWRAEGRQQGREQGRGGGREAGW